MWPLSGLSIANLDSMEIEKSKLLLTLRWLCVLLAIPLVAIQKLAANVHIHGDHLYPESLYEHLVVRGLEIGSFVFTQASFLFPDGLIYLPIRYLLSHYDLRLTHMIYANLSMTVLILLMSKIMHLLWPKLSLLTRLEVGAAFVLITMYSGVYSHFLFWPVHHGVLIHFSLWLMYLLILAQRSDRLPVLPLVCLYVISILLTFSDLLVVPQVFVPLSFVFAYRFIHNRKEMMRGEWDVLLFSGLGATQGYVALRIVDSYKLLTMTYKPVDISVYNFLTSCLQFLSDLPRILNQSLFSGILVVALLVLLLSMRRRRGAFTKEELMLSAFTVGAIGYLVVLFGAGYWHNYYKVRYSLIVWVLPMSVLLMMHLNQRVFGLSLKRGLQALLILIVLLHLPKIEKKSFYLRDYTTAVECLDQHWKNGDLPNKYGLSDFWISRLLLFQSQQGLEVMQVHGTNKVHKWMNSMNWYRYNRHGEPISSYTYVVNDQPFQPEKTKEVFGEPAKQLFCPKSPNLTVLVYPQGLQLMPSQEVFEPRLNLANK